MPITNPGTLSIPKGSQVIRQFTLTPPANPSPTNPITNWQLTFTDTSVTPPTTTPISGGIVVSFTSNACPYPTGSTNTANCSTEIEREYERGVIVVDLMQPTTSSIQWRFTHDGVQPGDGTSDSDHDIFTEISNQGTRLTAIIHSSASSSASETVHFNYIAAYTDLVHGVVTTYVSADPGISVGRPASS